MEKHICKVCSKRLPCGRSLGGHMRSHMHFYPSDAEKEKLEKNGYGLRENPKKTWRLSDFAGEDPTSSSSSLKRKQCKECGKEFPSWKALFGHMRCHSDKLCRPNFETEQEKDQEEEEEGSWKRRSKLDSTASSTTLYEEEQEEVAISLMMLSRDVVGGCWALADDSSDKQSAVLEEDDLRRSDEFGGFDLEDSSDESRREKILTIAEFGKKRRRIDEKGNHLNAYEAKLGREKLKLESKYQCTTCNRGFDSYQALGGHRASHKRIRGGCLQNPNASFYETEEHLTVEVEDPHSGLSKKTRIHECSICGKTFSSGQALGGHKRSHIVSNVDSGSQAAAEPPPAAAVKVPELLDLNLPATVDEESSNVKPWWIGESIKHEQHMVDLISN